MGAGSRVVSMAHRQSASNNMYSILNRYYINLPKYITPKVYNRSNSYIVIPSTDNHYSLSNSGSLEVGRSETIQYFHGSEVAFLLHNKHILI